MRAFSHLVSIALLGLMAGLPSVANAQASKTPTPTTAPAAKAEPMDINTATKEQLMTLEGIGEARSVSIISHRPYKAKNELVDKNVLSQAVYDKIKDHIIAKHVAAPPPKR